MFNVNEKKVQSSHLLQYKLWLNVLCMKVNIQSMFNLRNTQSRTKLIQMVMVNLVKPRKRYNLIYSTLKNFLLYICIYSLIFTVFYIYINSRYILMNPNSKMILMIGSSSKNSKFPGQRSSMSNNNKGVPLTGVKYDIKIIQKRFHN
jgi:hypothetical protein